MNPPDDAHEIVEEFLETTWEALNSGNLAAFAHRYNLPMVIETFDGLHHMGTLDDLRTVFDTVREFHATIGLLFMERHVISASFTAPGVIMGTHETRLLCHGNLLHRAPYPVMSEYRLIEGRWQVTHSLYAVDTDGISPRSRQGRAARPGPDER